MKNFIVPNNHLSDLYLKSYNKEIDEYENLIKEISSSPRDVDFANAVSALPILITSIFRHSNKLDDKIIELYEFNYRMGGNIVDIINQIPETITRFIESKPAPKPTTIKFKGLKPYIELGLNFSSDFENCKTFDEIATSFGSLIAYYDIKNNYIPYLQTLTKSENTKNFKVISFRQMQKFEQYKSQLNSDSSDNEIIWVYLNLLYDEQEEIGIYYVLPTELIENKRIIKIVKKIESLKLADNVGSEFGNTNIYMKITEKGDSAIENFKSLAQYQKHLEELESKKGFVKTSITNNIIDSKIQNSTINQGSDLSNLSNTRSVSHTPAQKELEKKNIWSMIPEWAKILGGLGAIAGLIKVIIELNKP